MVGTLAETQYSCSCFNEAFERPLVRAAPLRPITVLAWVLPGFPGTGCKSQSSCLQEGCWLPFSILYFMYSVIIDGPSRKPLRSNTWKALLLLK